MNIAYIHRFLNELYQQADRVEDRLKRSGVKCRVNMPRFNYLFLEGEYKLQRYPIPVVEVEGVGDIGFNLDGVFFEFSFSREDFNDVHLEELIREYRIEVYGGKDCHLDFYREGDTFEDVLHRIDSSYEEVIMMSIYPSLGDTVSQWENVLKIMNNEIV